jgi:hypothetical protein
VLDDPWHPGWVETFSRDRQAIHDALTESKAYAAWLAVRRDQDRLETDLWVARRRMATFERLLRALDTPRLAAQLRTQGGEAWRRFERLLACERSAP